MLVQRLMHFHDHYVLVSNEFRMSIHLYPDHRFQQSMKNSAHHNKRLSNATQLNAERRQFNGRTNDHC